MTACRGWTSLLGHIAVGLRRSAALACLTLAGLSHATMAWAGPAEQADAAFNAGAEAYARGDYREAALSFEQAFAVMPHSVAKYSAGVAWEALGDRPRAAECYVEALGRRELEPSQAQDAQRRLDALERRLATLHVEAPAGSRVSGARLRDASPPVDVWVEPGSHAIDVVFVDGARAHREVTTRAGERSRVELRAPAAGRAPTDDAQPDEPSTEASTVQLAVGGATLGLGVTAAVAAIGLGVSALDARDEFVDSGLHDADAHDRADTLRTWTNVCWVGAGVLGATGVVLLATASAWDEAPTTEGSEGSVALTVTATLGGLHLSGRF